MTNNLPNFLAWFSRSPWYWLALILLGLSMESVALFYQHGLEYSPCKLCIHVRIWVVGMILVGLAGLSLRGRRFPGFITHLLQTGIAAGLLERSWMLLGTERGFVIGSCDMESGLPSWFALDEWFPPMFKALEPCGYTPELLFGVTMAEALIVLSSVLLLLGVTMSISSLLRR